jgi:lipoprotein-anchoring transpeptidase ErfK/SrfK
LVVAAGVSTIKYVIRRLGVVVLVIAVLAPALSGDAAPPALIPDGVTVAGVPVGGMSNEQAQAALRPAFAKPVQLVFTTRQWRIVPARFGAKVGLADGVAAAMSARPGSDVALTPTVDHEAVRTFVRALDKRISYPAKDAELAGLEGLQPKLTPEQTGIEVLRQLTEQRITRALQSPQIHRVRVAAKIIEPKRTVADFGPVIVIRRGANELRYYLGAKLVRTFGVATGQSVYPTPLGRFTIQVKWRNPWWYPPSSRWAKGLKPVPPGPNNPLGTRWMGLTAPGVGIHGTPNPASIGYSLSHGCIRMYIADAEWLFNTVDIGTTVFIVSA